MIRSLLFVCLIAGCQHRDNEVRTPAPPAVAPTTAQASTVPQATPEGGGISGRVVETMDAAGYTYARLENGTTQTWIAGPQAKLAVGTQLANLDGQLMADFHSNTLNRTFDQIYFVGTFGPGIASAAHAAAPVTGHHPPQPATAESPAPAGEAVSGTVVTTMDAAGYTYAELDQGGTKVWVAGPTTKLAVGTKLGQMSGTLMTAFRSNTLGRTFDQIYFVSSYALP